MKKHLKTLLGIVLSVLLLWWALRDVSPAEVLHEVRRADPLLFALAIAATVASFLFRALRWGIFLRPVTPGVPFRPRFAATMIGFAANNLLPARVGEFARALTLARVTAVPTAASFATLVLERVFDAFVLVGLLFLAMAATSFPALGEVAGVDPRQAARVVALVVGLFGLLLFALVAAPRRSVRGVEALANRLLPASLRRPLVAGLESFVAGLGVLRDGRLFALSAAWALAQWVFGAWSYLLALRAFGIDEVSFAGAVFLQSLVALAVAVPSSPGFFGPFEAAAKLGLALWGVAPQKAVSFAVGFHIGGFIPVTLMGLYYAWRLNLRWSEVQRSEEVVEDRVERGPGGEPALQEGG